MTNYLTCDTKDIEGFTELTLSEREAIHRLRNVLPNYTAAEKMAFAILLIHEYEPVTAQWLNIQPTEKILEIAVVSTRIKDVPQEVKIAIAIQLLETQAANDEDEDEDE